MAQDTRNNYSFISPPENKYKKQNYLILRTVLGMITTQSDKLLANGATTVRFSFARSRVIDYSTHLLAAC